MKKGFTLIELLAVIVILAIIALIATPIVLNIIEDAKRSANERSIDNYARALSNEIARRQMNGDFVSLQDTIDKMEYSGSRIECGVAKVKSNGMLYLNNCSVDDNLVENFESGEKTHDTSPMISVHTGTNKITGYTLDKTGNIGLDIYSNVSGNSHITYSITGGNSGTIYPTDNAYYKVPVDPAKIGSSINIKLYLGETEVDSYTTSIKDYASAVLNNSSYSDSHDLIKSIVTFGRTAQIYFNNDNTNLPDDMLTEPVDLSTINIDREYISNFRYNIKLGSIPGMTQTRSFSFSSTMDEILYIAVDSGLTINDLTMERDGKILTALPTGQRYYLLANVDYLNIDTELKTTITKGNEKYEAISSPLAYLLTMADNTSKTPEFRSLCASAIYYYQEANKYYY